MQRRSAAPPQFQVLRLTNRREPFQTNDLGLTPQMQRGGVDQSFRNKEASQGIASIERSRNLEVGDLANCLGHKPVAEVAIGRQTAGGYADDTGVSWQVHGVRDDSRR